MRVKPLTLKEAEAKAKEINDALSAYDFTPNNYVRVVTDEGAEFTFPSAFALVYNVWYLVLAEHHDPHVFHKEDVNQIFSWSVTCRQDNIPYVEKFKPRKPKPVKKQSKRVDKPGGALCSDMLSGEYGAPCDPKRFGE